MIQAFLGVTGVTGPQGLILVGVRMVGPDSVSIMQPTIPVWVALLTAVLGLEKLTLQKAFGVLCAVCGAMVMVNVASMDLRSARTVGMLIMLLQVMSYAVFIVALSQYLKRVPKPFTIFYRASVFGALPLVLLAAMDAHVVKWSKIPASSWVILVYCALGVSFVAHSSVSWAVRHVSPTIPSLYTCLQPVAVTVMSSIVYGDVLDLYDLIGMLLILSGLIVTVRAQQQVMNEKEAGDITTETIRLVQLESAPSHPLEGRDVVSGDESSVS